MTTTVEETTTVPVNLEDDVTCEAQWPEADHECGKPASWRAAVHNRDCRMETANFCTGCITELKLAAIFCICPKCRTRDLLRDIRKI